jgi:hypothetical protein
VVWFYSYGANTIPESRRYAPEFELFLLAAVFEFFRVMWSSGAAVYRAAAGFAAFFLAAAGLPQAGRYLTQGFAGRHPFPRERSIEYQLARRLEELHPAGRIHATGGLRFRLNAWCDLAQTGGGFESGLTSREVLSLAHCVRTAECGDPVDALSVLGGEYVVVHGTKSREHYRDLREGGAQFAGRLEEAARVEDDTIYRVPFRSLAHLVREDETDLKRYAGAVRDAVRPRLTAAWSGPSRLEIAGPVGDGMLVSVQVRAETGWTAAQKGRPLEVQRGPFGWILLRPEPDRAARIALVYRGTAEQRWMGGLCGAVWAASLAGWLASRRRDARKAS